MTKLRPEEPSLDPIPAEIVENHPKSSLRFGVAFVWSDLMAEIARETAGNVPNPWSPDPEGDEAA